MAASTATKGMLRILLSAAFIAGMASAQLQVQPSNATLPTSKSDSETVLRLTGLFGSKHYNIAPLTSEVGEGQSQTAINDVVRTGNLKLADASNTNNITTNDLVLMTCDPNGSNLDSATVATQAGNQKPQAIILYSSTSQACDIGGSWTYSSVFTLTSLLDTKDILSTLGLYPPTSNIITAKISSNTTIATNTGFSSTNNDGGPAPTTAVAMSILYSITGIITLLFLVIIATGAVRAHRHPERYGPRNGLPGRPRQSRAKGLARAMLETLPIVKFGDPEPIKPDSNRDIELEDGNTSVHIPVTAAVGTENKETKERTKGPENPSVAVVESGMGPAQAESIKSNHEATPKAGGLGCSICTEDFTTGEDVRVLPCDHKYHPACIDPWLLNVSGTCPLCRHDLRPVATNPENVLQDGELPPPLSAHDVGGENTDTVGDGDASNPQRRRMSRFLDANRLGNAPPEERIATLRRLREQTQRDGETSQDVDERSRTARLTGRLRDTFRIRTRAENAPSS